MVTVTTTLRAGFCALMQTSKIVLNPPAVFETGGKSSFWFNLLAVLFEV